MTAGSFADGLRAKARRRRETLGRPARAPRAPNGIRNDLLPSLQLVEKPVADLKPPVRNVRPPDPAHVQDIANSIAALGFSRPVLIDAEGSVLDGWASVEAARTLGLRLVSCIVISHLSASERRVLRIALNRLGEKGRWDLGELKLELAELVLEDAPLEVTGFSEIEIDTILLDEEPAVAEPGPIEPDPGVNPVAQAGEIYALGPHRLACGDARDPELLARLLEGDQVRLVLTDVPYNVPIRGHVTGGRHREFAMASGEMTADEFGAFNSAWISTAHRHLVDGGVLATFIDWRGWPTVHTAALTAGLDPLNLIIWSKTNAGMGSLYRSAHELLPLFKKGRAPHVNNVALGKHGRWRSNVWTYPGASSVGSDARRGLKEHPTVKPVAMLEDALLDLTARGEVVLDPFLGSGSTLIAAEKSGRLCRGVEVDPIYVDLVLRRYEAVTGRSPVRISL